VYHRLIPPLLPSRAELAIVAPKDVERSAVAPALGGDVHDRRSRCARREEHVPEQRHIHHLEGPLPQLQRRICNEIEYLELVTGSGPEANRSSVGDSAV